MELYSILNDLLTGDHDVCVDVIRVSHLQDSPLGAAEAGHHQAGVGDAGQRHHALINKFSVIIE